MEYNATNPFDEEGGNNFHSGYAPPLPTKQVSTGYVDPETQRRAEELQRKEDELNRREAVLDQRGKILVEREKLSKDPRQANWPRCKPFIYHNIAEDMKTPTLQRLLRLAYIGWMFTTSSLIWNAVTLLITLVTEGDTDDIGNFILSVVYFFILTPLWFLTYRILYRGGRKQKPSLFIVYFIFLVFELVGVIFLAIGIPKTGSGGFFLMIKVFDNNKKPAGFFLLSSAILWCIASVYGIWLFILARLEYRKLGGLAKAKTEFAATAVEQAAKHPDLVISAAKMGATQYAKN